MKYFFLNKKLLDENKKFFTNCELYSVLSKVDKNDIIIGWGRKKSGKKAIEIASKYNCKYLLCEDGFYRSIMSGKQGGEALSIIKDDIGIFYDAQEPSKLENILNNDDNFNNLNIEKIHNNIKFIVDNSLSKYNLYREIPINYFNKTTKKRLLFASQTFNDLSLKLGFGEEKSTIDIILYIIKHYPVSKFDYYLKIHPETLNGDKKNDISIDTFENYGFHIIKENFNPIDLIKYFDVITTKTSQIGFDALLLNKEVVCFGAPFYSNWGLTTDLIKINRRTASRTIEELFYASTNLYTEYINPFNQKNILFEEALHILNYLKNIYSTYYDELHFYGFSLWKRNYVSLYIKSKKNYFHNYSPSKKQVKKQKNIVWGMKNIKNISDNDNVIRIEDGFIRSISLGSDLTQPLSLIFDKTGIYFNSNKPSDLENLLNNDNNFNDILRGKGDILIEILNKTGLSKYNNTTLNTNFKIDTTLNKILVVGQVDGDASLLYNEDKNLNNYDFLKRVKGENPDSYIIYKPHPDILSGNRKTKIELSLFEEHCDLILTDIHIHDAIKNVDEVHVMTSLSGLEALIRGKKVICYGTPFYSNWGLTIDKIKIERRTKKRTLSELVATTYILYPRYIHPETNKITDVFAIVEYLNNNMKSNSFCENKYISIRRKIINWFKRIFNGTF